MQDQKSERQSDVYRSWEITSLGIPYKLIITIRGFIEQNRLETGREPTPVELETSLVTLEGLNSTDKDTVTRLARLALSGFDAVPIDMTTVDVPGPDYTSEIALEKLRLEEESKQLWVFLSQLTTRQRDVLLERYGKDKDQTQISRELGISPARVSKLEQKALSILRKKYRQAGYTRREK